jgi:DNA-binding transcriptional MerR regulator
METKRYTIEELVDLTSFSRRTIRYYVQEGLLEPPAGRGRGGFYYDSHLDRLLEIRSLQGRGMKLAAIRQMLQEGAPIEKPLEREVWARYPVLPGVEIHVVRGMEENKRKELLEVIRAARSILTGNEKEDSHG